MRAFCGMSDGSGGKGDEDGDGWAINAGVTGSDRINGKRNRHIVFFIKRDSWPFKIRRETF
jgi:hypothetical protein